ncbi:unnamed protein product [Vitrella brassicaformis CCMP3155]|uniref:CAMK/RAD53 protein kinase n=3 Tax=Vitrella brassicaformis TaxID=1169539 RepID=A0A0G4END3_VITBC|nr:unnamed protein product [Vitrella brassicaformis CCMP3155]|eukprot:CEL99347.1 unnamed protein product [Vitrella brassicaformis CCMP3155]
MSKRTVDGIKSELYPSRLPCGPSADDQVMPDAAAIDGGSAAGAEQDVPAAAAAGGGGDIGVGGCVATQTQPNDTQDQGMQFIDDPIIAKLISLNPLFPTIYLRQKDPEKVVIGRSPYADCQIAHDKISGKHCTISRSKLSKGKYVWRIKDSSRNGTFLDGRRLMPAGSGGEGRGGDGSEILTNGAEISLIVNSVKAMSVQNHPDQQIKWAPVFCFMEVTPAEEPKPGSIHEDYAIGEELGSGHFSTVKFAIERATDTPVAIKQIDMCKFVQFKNKQKSNLDQFTELQVLENLHHENIIQLHKHYTDDRYLYLVFELAPGGDLLDFILDHGPIPEETTQRMFREICEGLAYLHRNNIVHRPENILMTEKSLDGRCKLTDFGLAKYSREKSVMRTFCGTPQYTAPEVFGTQDGRAAGYGKEVDLWSLGVILYVMLSATSPFDDDMLKQQICAGAYSLAHAQWQHISAQAKNLVTSLLQTNHERRLKIDGVLNHPFLSPPPAPAPVSPGIPKSPSPHAAVRSPDGSPAARRSKKRRSVLAHGVAFGDMEKHFMDFSQPTSQNDGQEEPAGAGRADEVPPEVYLKLENMSLTDVAYQGACRAKPKKPVEKEESGDSTTTEPREKQQQQQQQPNDHPMQNTDETPSQPPPAHHPDSSPITDSEMSVSPAAAALPGFTPSFGPGSAAAFQLPSDESPSQQQDGQAAAPAAAAASGGFGAECGAKLTHGPGVGSSRQAGGGGRGWRRGGRGKQASLDKWVVKQPKPKGK